MAFYNLSDREGTATISVFFDDGDTRVIPKTSATFAALLEYLLANDTHDEDVLRRLVDPAVFIGSMLQEEFGDRVTFDMRHFYLDGIPETSALSRIVGDKVLNGDVDWLRMVRFLVRLDGNPSRKAKDAIWEWVEKHGVSITEDGRIAGFKGLVQGTDALTGETLPVSYHSGPNNFIDGEIYGEPGVHYQVPHRVGTVISKRRGDVDDSGALACSTGLHVGAYSYAKTFGENRQDGARYSTMGRMADSLPNSTFAIVIFAPEDVVSVPDDRTSDWKIRVERYEVSEFLETVEDVLVGKTTYDVKVAAPFIPAGESYSPEPEVLPDVEVEAAPFTEIPDGNEADVEASTPWKVVEFDNLGTTVLESFETREAAEEAEEGWVERDPEGDYEVQHHDPVTGLVSDPDDVEDDEPETVREIPTLDPEDVPVEDDEEPESIAVSFDGSPSSTRVTVPEKTNPTLADWAEINSEIKRDLHDPKMGHKPLAAKWSDITTEASVRRYRKSNGVNLSLITKIKG